MEPGRQDHWDLPAHIITQILAPLPPKQIAQCASIASVWTVAVQDPTLKTRLDLEKSWRRGDVEPVEIGVATVRVICATRRRALIAIGGVSFIRIWDIEKRETVWGFETDRSSCSLCLLGDVVLSGDQGGYISVWDIESNVLASRFNAHLGMVACLLEVGDVVASAGEDRRIRLWRKGTWDCEQVLLEESPSFRSLASTSDGKLLLAGSQVGTIQVWDVSIGKRVGTLRAHSSAVLSLSVCMDCVVSGSFDGVAKVWVINDGRCIHRYPGFHRWVRCVDFDGGRVAIGSDKTVDVWDVGDHQNIRSVHVAFEPIGVWIERSRLVVVDKLGIIRTWDFLP